MAVEQQQRASSCSFICSQWCLCQRCWHARAWHATLSWLLLVEEPAWVTEASQALWDRGKMEIKVAPGKRVTLKVHILYLDISCFILPSPLLKEKEKRINKRLFQVPHYVKVLRFGLGESSQKSHFMINSRLFYFQSFILDTILQAKRVKKDTSSCWDLENQTKSLQPCTGSAMPYCTYTVWCFELNASISMLPCSQ